MNNLINFIVTTEDGGYTASAVNAFIVTQGDTFDELLKNIQDATSLYFAEDKNISSPFFNILYSQQVTHA
jgi:predicted RNase H-like HicB family nuclease